MIISIPLSLQSICLADKDIYDLLHTHLKTCLIKTHPTSLLRTIFLLILPSIHPPHSLAPLPSSSHPLSTILLPPPTILLPPPTIHLFLLPPFTLLPPTFQAQPHSSLLLPPIFLTLLLLLRIILNWILSKWWKIYFLREKTPLSQNITTDPKWVKRALILSENNKRK